ncbi:MAG: methionyl-tRNA formyltransferase [Alphaproteobacteria bacterium]|nr:methionyl-tRNA formyltransferase [Alphaproteobacteria bacterium]
MIRAVVATVKPWNIDIYKMRVARLPGEWRLVQGPDELTVDFIDSFRPDYVFFPHWSWRVPDWLLTLTECVCFHMTDVPFGRGGSPLQNLIVRGVSTTLVSALKMVPQMDAGPVYLKRPLPLEGRAQDIYERCGLLVFDMIEEIVRTKPVPVEQTGPITVFSRRTPDESLLPTDGDQKSLYDHIRMLDADTYPPAFLEWGNLRLEFTHAQPERDGVAARVFIRRRET